MNHYNPYFLKSVLISDRNRFEELKPSNRDIADLLEHDPTLASSVPRRFLTEDHIKYAIERHPKTLLSLKPEDITAEIAQLAFDRDAYAVIALPAEHVTKEMYMRAIELEPIIIKHASKHRDEAAWILAISKTSNYIQFCPREDQTEAIALTFAQLGSTLCDAVSYIRADLLTDEVLGKIALYRTHFDLVPNDYCMRAMRYQVENNLGKRVLSDDVSELIEYAAESRLTTEKAHFEAMVKLEKAGPDAVRPHVDTELKSEIFRDLFGTKLAIEKLGTLGSKKRWIEQDLGL